MKEKLKCVIVAFSLILYVGLTCITNASSTPAVSIDPPEVKDLSPGQSFSVNITITGITINETVGHKCYGLYGWSIDVAFDPAVINVVDATEGPFLKEIQETIFASPTKNNEAGYVRVGSLFMPPLPERGAEGSGVLATITFNVTGQGVTDLHFQSSKINTKIEGNNIAIEHIANDGKFMNTAAPLVLSNELIIAVGVVVAIGGGLALFLYKRRQG